MAWVFTACVLPGGEFSLEMSAANLHLLILADQRVEHEDEGKEVEVDGEADLEEHVGDRFSAAGGRQLSTAGSDPCLNCVSVCVCWSEETQVTTTFWGD